MNKDQVKGTLKETAVKVQEGAGKIVGSDSQRAKGIAKEVEGKTQKTAGDLEEAVHSSRNNDR